VLVAIGGVVVGIVLFAGVTNVISSGGARSKSTERFVLGPATPLAATIGRRGPLLLPDPLGRGRDVYVVHLGGGDWRTVDAHPPGATGSCVVNWRSAQRAFVDVCNHQAYPPDGAGLNSFPTEVDGDGRVVIDLRHLQPPSATTVPATTVPATTSSTPAAS
jgi:hypothetical protein